MRLRVLPRGMPLVLLILALVCAFIPLAGGATVANAASPAAASVQFSQNPVPSGTAVTVTGCGFGTVAQGSVSYSVYTYPGGTLVAGPTTPTLGPPGSGDCFTFSFTPPTATGAYSVVVTADGVTASNVLQVVSTTTPPSVTFAPNPAPGNVNVTATLCNITANPGTVSVSVTNSSGGTVSGPTLYNVTATATAGCYTFSLVSPLTGGAYTVTITGGTGANSFTAVGTLNVNTTTPTGTSLTFVSPVASGNQQTATICGFPAGLTQVSVAIVSNTTHATVSSYTATLVASTNGCYTFTLAAPVALDRYTVTVSGGGATATGTLVVNTGVGTLYFSPNPASPGQTVTAYNVCGFANGLPSLYVTIRSNTSGQTVFTQLVPVTASNGAGCYTLSFSAPSTADSYTVSIGTTATGTISGTLVVSGTTFIPGALTLTPNVASPGTTVVAIGCGFTFNDVLSLNIYYFANSFNQVAATPSMVGQPVVTSSVGSGVCYSVSFVVPNLPSGVYTVTLSGAISGTVDSGTLTVNNGVCTTVTCCTTTNCCITTNCCNTVNCCISGITCCNTVNCCVNSTTCCYTSSCCLTITTATGTSYCSGATLTASPTSVVPGTVVTLTGAGFYPGAALTISGLGNSQVVATSSGTFAASLSVPLGTAAGTYTVTATDSTGRTASATITVVSTAGIITPSVTSALCGTTITVTLSGFGPNEQVSLSLGAPSTAPYAIAGTIQLFTANSSGAVTAQYVVPACSTLTAGSYDLLALGQTSRVFVFTGFTLLSGTPLPTTPVPTPVPPVVVPPVSTPSLPSVGAASTTTYFADGYTGTASSNGKATFTERISLYNPGTTTSSVTTTYYVYDPSTTTRTTLTETDSVAPGATVVRVVNQDVGDNRMVSVRVRASSGIVAEERIDRTSNTGATLDNDSSRGSRQLATSWYFAEGYTGITLQEYITLFNPSTTTAHAQVQYLPGGSTAAPAAVPVTVPAQGQVTINVRSQYNHLVPSGSRDVAAMVTSDTPIVADRAMYWGDGSGSGKFGYSLAPGVSSGATSQSFALLPTSSGSQSFVTVLNPNSTAATVTLTLRNASGGSLATASQAVGPRARYTFVVPNILPGDNGYVSGTLTSAQPVVAEAALYFGGSPNHGAHPGMVVPGSQGVQVGARADVNQRGAVLRVFNPNSTSVRVQVTVGSVVWDGIVAGNGAQVVSLPSGTGVRGVLVLASDTVVATVLNGGVGNAKAWGGNLTY